MIVEGGLALNVLRDIESSGAMQSADVVAGPNEIRSGEEKGRLAATLPQPNSVFHMRPAAR